MTLVAGLVVLVPVSLIGVTWLVAGRAVGRGAPGSAQRVWSTTSTAILALPSLVEEQCDRGAVALRGIRHRVTLRHSASLVWVVVGSLVGTVVWVTVFVIATKLDVHAFEQLKFAWPAAMGIVVAIANSLFGSLLGDLAGITQAWPLPNLSRWARWAAAGVVATLFVAVLASQAVLGVVRADSDLTKERITLEQSAETENVLASGLEAPDEAAAREDRQAAEQQQLEARRGRQILMSGAVPVLVGLMEAAAATTVLNGVALLLLVPTVAASAVLWIARLPFFLLRNALTFGLRAIIDLFAAHHAIEPQAVDDRPDVEGVPGDRVADQPAPEPATAAQTSGSVTSETPVGAGSPSGGSRSSDRDDPMWNHFA